MSEDKKEGMRRIALRVAYDGTGYHGWQLQPHRKTIEGELNSALNMLTGESVRVIGASRTDAGVHALGNVAVFDTASRIPAERFAYALNRFLPEDITIQGSYEVADDFHPRHCDSRKTYEYRILNRTFPLPEYRHTACFEYGSLDLASMRQAGACFAGEHDFASFCSAGAQVQTTVRTVYSLEILERGILPGEDSRLLTIRIQGNGFLYNMVRIIAGTLLEVGRGHISADRIEDMIAARDRRQAGPTAPARGLTLVGIEFRINEKDNVYTGVRQEMFGSNRKAWISDGKDG